MSINNHNLKQNFTLKLVMKLKPPRELDNILYSNLEEEELKSVQH